MSALVNALSRFLPITSLQVEHYHADTHSFAQRRAAISSVLNGLRTLCIVTGGVPPARPRTIREFRDRHSQPFVFTALQILAASSLHSHPAEQPQSHPCKGPTPESNAN